MQTPSFATAVIKPLLAAKGWKAIDLAVRMNINRSLVSNWEKGTVMPDNENLRRLAQIYPFSVEQWIFYRDFGAFARKMQRQGIDPEKFIHFKDAA